MEVLVREMHYDPKDAKKRVPETEPVYYHFSTLEEALEFMREIEEKYRNYPIKLLLSIVIITLDVLRKRRLMVGIG